VTTATSSHEVNAAWLGTKSARTPHAASTSVVRLRLIIVAFPEWFDSPCCPEQLLASLHV
jgi:hypothetical protein